MGGQSRIYVVTSASGRHLPVQCHDEQPAQHFRFPWQKRSPNCLFRNILRLSHLNSRFCRAESDPPCQQAASFQYFASNSENKISQRSGKKYVSNSLLWKILRVSGLFTRFCREQGDQTRANSFRKKILRDSPKKLFRHRQYTRLTMLPANGSVH